MPVMDISTMVKEAFAEAWCLSEHEYHVAGDDVPCLTAKRVAGLAPGGNQLMDYFMTAMARVSAHIGYVHTHGDDFDGCSTCFDEKFGRDLDTGRPVGYRLGRILCRQPAPDRDAPGLCLWCKHPVSVGEWK